MGRRLLSTAFKDSATTVPTGKFSSSLFVKQETTLGSGIDAVIHLRGEAVVGRSTGSKKACIRSSRIPATDNALETKCGHRGQNHSLARAAIGSGLKPNGRYERGNGSTWIPGRTSFGKSSPVRLLYAAKPACRERPWSFLNILRTKNPNIHALRTTNGIQCMDISA